MGIALPASCHKGADRRVGSFAFLLPKTPRKMLARRDRRGVSELEQSVVSVQSVNDTQRGGAAWHREFPGLTRDIVAS